MEHKRHDMTQKIELKTLNSTLLGARLEVARLFKYPDTSIASMCSDLQLRHGISKGTYYCHERGTRKPHVTLLRIYAEFFEIPFDYFLSGEDGEAYEDQARTIAARQRKTLRIDSFQGSGNKLTLPVNQRLQLDKNTSFQKGRLRLIVKLMADDLKRIANGEQKLEDVSGDVLPAPPYLHLSEQIAWWQIPDYDFSMVGDIASPALPPGTLCLIDMEAVIEPLKFVVAVLPGQDEPLVRQYVSDRIWAPGTRFSLHPLNPQSEVITVDEPDKCCLLARIVFSGSPR